MKKDPATLAIMEAAQRRTRELEREVSRLKFDSRASTRRADLAEQGLKDLQTAHAAKAAPIRTLRAGKPSKHGVRFIIPDSHGSHIDPTAAAACLADLKWLAPQEIVLLGDHLDCGGTFNQHQRSYTNELCESYVDDLAAANQFLDKVREYAPNAQIHYLEGNHEAHVERWAARNMHIRADADLLLKVYGPAAQLKLKAREITYYKSKDFHMGLAVRGSIKIGKCFFTHGISHSKHADASHLAAFSGNVVFGHVHRVMSVGSRTVTSQGHGAWSPGTLAKLQPLYRHTEPTTWQHGFAVQFYNESSGRFSHFNVPIFDDGTTGLAPLVGAVRERVA